MQIVVLSLLSHPSCLAASIVSLLSVPVMVHPPTIVGTTVVEIATSLAVIAAPGTPSAVSL